jgi:hypothetical protein
MAGWLAVDIIFVVVYIAWIFFFPKLEAKGLGPTPRESFPSIKSVRELDASKKYVVFSNYVFNA